MIAEESELLREDYMNCKFLSNNLGLKVLKTLYDSGELVLNKIALEKIQFYLHKDKILDIAG